MTALNNLSMSVKVSVSGTGSVNKTGSDYKALAYPLSITKNVGPFTTAIANNASLGSDECASFLTTIASGTNGTISLQSLTDLVDQSGISLARVKGFILRLLSSTDDNVSGTPCTGITVNPRRSVTDAVLNSTTTITSATANFTSNDVGMTVTGYGIPASTTIATVNSATSVTLSNAATVTATGVGILIATTSPAAAPGLTNATLSNGDVLAWTTPAAAGTTISSTAKNLYIVNNDGAHSAAVQLTVIGGTT